MRTYWDELNQRTSVTRPGPRWQHPHATLYLFVPAQEIGRHLAQVLADPAHHAGARSPTLFGVFPWRARHFTCPLFQVPRAADTFFAFYLFRTADDVASVTAMVASNRVLYDRARAVGAKIYPVSALPFTGDDWKEHFGPVAWRRFAAAKRDFDPNGILTPGPAISAPQTRETVMLNAILHRLAALFAPKAVPTLGRNEPCHCGSGRKYKKCCLEKDAGRLRSERERGRWPRGAP